jgi:hypothetical protein
MEAPSLDRVCRAALELQAFCKEQDWADVDKILMRQGKKMNTALVFQELQPLVELKEDSSILLRLEALMLK